MPINPRMEKKKHVDPLQFDKRVMQRFVTSGKMTGKELETHLAELPDMSDQCDDIADIVYEAEHEGASSEKKSA